MSDSKDELVPLSNRMGKALGLNTMAGVSDLGEAMPSGR